MTIPTFEYRTDDYLPERLEQYLRRFEELMAFCQSTAVNAAADNQPQPGMSPSITAGSPVLQSYTCNGDGLSLHSGFEQDIRREIYSRFVTGGEIPATASTYAGYHDQSPSPADSGVSEVLGELRIKLDELIRAIEQNSERLGEQNRDTLELSD